MSDMTETKEMSENNRIVALLNYTEPNRNDGAWEGEVGAPDSDNAGYPEVDVYVRRNTSPMYGSHKPVCAISDPDFAEGGKCAGNLALICYAPEMYEALLEARSLLIKRDGNLEVAGRVIRVVDNVKLAAEEFYREANDDEREKD